LKLLLSATWLLTGRFTAAAPGATEFLGEAFSALEREGRPVKEPGAFALLLGIFWKLSLVVVLIWLTVWVLRRMLKAGGMPVAAQGAVKVLAATHLDARKTIYLIEVGERLLVVGGGSESLSLLAEITSPPEKAAIREKIQQESAGGKFSSYLSAWTAKMGGGGGAASQFEEGKGFLRQQLDELRKRRKGREET